MSDLPPTQFVTVNGVRLAYCHWPGRPGAPALPVVRAFLEPLRQTVL